MPLPLTQTFTLKMGGVCGSQVSLNIHQITYHYNPDDSNFHKLHHHYVIACVGNITEQTSRVYRIWGSHSGGLEDFYLLMHSAL
jgi:hypothetical protein